MTVLELLKILNQRPVQVWPRCNDSDMNDRNILFIPKRNKDGKFDEESLPEGILNADVWWMDAFMNRKTLTFSIVATLPTKDLVASYGSKRRKQTNGDIRGLLDRVSLEVLVTQCGWTAEDIAKAYKAKEEHRDTHLL